MSRISRRAALRQGALWAISPALLAGAAAGQTKTDPYADARLVDGEPPLPAADAFTVAVLPDTQHYSERFPETFVAQTEWIVAERKARRIAAVLHLGDITNRNTPEQWDNAVRGLSKLDGQLPYFFVPGNHDYSAKGVCSDRTTLLNEYFPVAKYKDLPNFGGVYDREPDRMENSCGLFSAGGRDFLVLALEFGPRRDVVRWANEMAAKHKDRAALLITHAYMYFDDTRYNWQTLGAKQNWNPHAYAVAKNTADDVSDGEDLWNHLVRKHENFLLTLNGHVLGDGLGRMTSPSPAGRDVHQVLVNFQMRPQGGDGWLRLLEFSGDGRTVKTCDYSPTRKQRNESPQNQFAMKLA